MFRLAASRLASPALRHGLVANTPLQSSATRTLSSTPAWSVRIRSSQPPASSSSSSSGSQPSPAEKPASVPEDISTPPPPFEPKVSSPGTTSGPFEASSSGPVETGAAAAHEGKPLPSASAPLEPPAPPAEEPTEPFDRSKLPSLDIDPEAAALPEPVKEGEGESGAGGKERTGAGRKEYVSSIERSRRRMLRLALGAVIIGGLGAAAFTDSTEGDKVCLSSGRDFCGQADRA